MKKIDLGEVIHGDDGKPLMEGDKKLTLGLAFGFAFAHGTIEADARTGYDGKLKTYLLGKKVAQERGVIELDDQEIEEVKARVGAVFKPVVIGKIDEMVFGAEGGKAPTAKAKRTR